jgi:hypothetical protein
VERSHSASAEPARVLSGFFEKNFWLPGPRYDLVARPCDGVPDFNRLREHWRDESGYSHGQAAIRPHFAFLQVFRLAGPCPVFA